MALTKITSEIIESNLTLTGTADGSTTPLTLKNTSTNAASEARIEFNQGGTSHGYITSSYNSNSPFMAFSVGSGSAEKVRITSGGNVGIGHVGDTTHRLRLTAGTGAARCLNMSVGNAGLCASTNNESGTGAYDSFVFTINGGATQVGSMSHGAGGTAYNTSSDYRLKENVDYTWDATTRLKQLRPARFNWILDETDTTVDGFLAHEVEDIVPEAVTGTKDATETLTNVVRTAGGLVLAEGVTEADWIQGKEDEVYESDSTWTASLTKDVYQQIDQSKLVPLLVKTIQELEARITTLENA